MEEWHVALGSELKPVIAPTSSEDTDVQVQAQESVSAGQCRPTVKWEHHITEYLKKQWNVYFCHRH